MDRIVGKSACEFLSGGVKMVRLTPRLCEGCNWRVMLVFGAEVAAFACYLGVIMARTPLSISPPTDT